MVLPSRRTRSGLVDRLADRDELWAGLRIDGALTEDEDEDDDDEYMDDVLDVFFNGQFRLATAMVPFVGQLAQAR